MFVINPGVVYNKDYISVNVLGMIVMIDYQLIYKTAFYMVAASISIAAMIFLLIDGWPDRRQTRVFFMLLCNITVSAVGGIVYKLLQPGAVGNSTVAAVMLTFQFLDFLAHVLLAPLFFIYVQNVTGSVYKTTPKTRLVYMIPANLVMLMVILNPLTGWIYYFDSAYNIYRNWGEIITYVMAVFYFVLSIIQMLLYWHAVNHRIRWALLYCFIITFMGVMIQLISIELSVELVAEAMGLVMLMLVVEREEDRIDQSTGTYNRSAFRADLDNFLRMGRHFHIIYVRIHSDDILKQLTGSFDDDSVFREVVSYFRQVHSKYQIYRVNNNSFVLVYHDSVKEQAMELAERIRKRFTESFYCNGVDFRLKTMIMVAGVPDELSSEKEIMQLVDSRFFEVREERILEGGDLSRFMYNVALERALHRGVSEHNYEVYYQPIYNKHDKSIFGAEAQISLNDPELGVVDEKQIFPLAEHHGIDIIISNMMLEEVCMFLGSGIPAELGLSHISVGLSVKQCIQPNFLDMLDRLVGKYNILPASINFEIPEPVDSEGYKQLSGVMRKLKDRGFMLSLKGYGTGYINMQSFSDLKFDIVNIDLGMLGDVEFTNTAKSILRNSIRMIKDMNFKILVEGASERRQVEWIEHTDVNYLQSDYYSKVVSQNELISILRATELSRRDEQRARAGSEAKSNFLANMSHEIRTPINAILGMNEMIIRESKNEAVLEYAKDIESASRSLLSLVNDILDFSKIEAGNMEIVPAEYDLGSLLNDVINMTKMRADKKRLDFVVDVDENLPERLFGDELRIRQIVLNILNNAVKYTDEGTVSLTVRGAFSSYHNVRLIFTVSDTGRGIQKEDMDKLFVMVGHPDMQKNKTTYGTGLGLAISNNLINLMDGSINVESEYGKGSTFTVVIPQTAVDLEPIGDIMRNYRTDKENNLEYQERFIAPEAHILIVDDTPINLTVIKSLLKRTKVRIDTALSGKECLELAGKKPYDIIFLDYRMPEMDGVTTLKIMHDMSEYPNMNTPIILLTANALSGAREQFMAEGFDDYMTKPVEGKKLEEILIRYLPKEKVILQESKVGEDSKIDRRQDYNADDYASEDGYDDGAPEEEETVEREKLNELRVRMEDLDEIDYMSGVGFCGSVDAYMEVLQIYAESVEQKASDIETFYNADDYENYTTQVHSLKSTSRLAGAVNISERAQELENAGINNDVALIKEKTEGLLEDFRELGTRLSDLFRKEDEREEEELSDISIDMLNDAYNTLSQFASMMDYEDALYILDELKQYKVSDNDKERIAKLRQAVEALDWDKVTHMISEIG